MKFLSLALLVSPVMGAVLHRRQLGPGDIPSQCQDACAGAMALQASCASLTCLCTASSDTSIQQCANCVIPLNPSLESTLQPYVNDFNLFCPGLPPLTFPPIPQSTDPATPPSSSDAGTPVTTDSSSDAATPTPATVLPAATDSTSAGNSALTTARTSSTSTQSPRAPSTSHTPSSTPTVTTSTQTSTGLFTAELSRFPVGLLILIATYALV